MIKRDVSPAPYEANASPYFPGAIAAVRRYISQEPSLSKQSVATIAATTGVVVQLGSGYTMGASGSEPTGQWVCYQQYPNAIGVGEVVVVDPFTPMPAHLRGATAILGVIQDYNLRVSPPFATSASGNYVNAIDVTNVPSTLVIGPGQRQAFEKLSSGFGQLNSAAALVDHDCTSLTEPVDQATIIAARRLLLQLRELDITDPALIPDIGLGPDRTVLLEWELGDRELWIYVRPDGYRSHSWENSSAFEAVVSIWSDPSNIWGLLTWLKG
jgi:hypothetical protein